MYFKWAIAPEQYATIYYTGSFYECYEINFYIFKILHNKAVNCLSIFLNERDVNKFVLLALLTTHHIINIRPRGWEISKSKQFNFMTLYGS